MYLPTTDEAERDAITAAFEAYAAKETETLGDEYGLRVHWAKIELPKEIERQKLARQTVHKRYPEALKQFREFREAVDPRGVLGNDMIEGLIGDPTRVSTPNAESDNV